MARPKKAPPKPETLELPVTGTGKTQGQVLAEHVAAGVVANAVTATRFTRGDLPELELTHVLHAMQAEGDRLAGGDLSGLERMLGAQMASLNACFAELMRRAMLNMGTHLDATERYLRLGLRAQGQAARTAEVLGNLKAGPALYARNANIVNGTQAVHVGAPPASLPRDAVTIPALLRADAALPRKAGTEASELMGARGALDA
jgi:hypothetical protein